ncbi:restriction endonuclease subunit S [Alteromonas sp. A081]|uniref:restriction endonuclease subunit S n=1 Tax=Alteromonas sp. A081 TaxID=3410269 RepID=UPI003B9880B3
MDKTIGLACNISTGKLDANQAVSGGKYPFFTCAEYPDQIDHFAFDDDVVLVAGNNARGNFHVSRYKGKFNAYQRTYILTAKEGFDIDYVYYALKLELKRLREKSQGSQTKFLTMPILTGIHFRDITGNEQTEIANVLTAIDKKIELNNRINAELEAMAKTLYDYWFVQFDFPDANGKPYKTSGGKMDFNPTLKREIPEGWSDKTLSQIANITMGQSPEGISYNDEGVGTIFYQGSTDFGWLFPTTRQYTTAPSRMAMKGDILLSVRAPVGDINIANTDCCIGRGLAALNSKTGSDGFLFYVMKYFKQIFERRNSEGTTFGSITKNDLHSLTLAYPTLDLLKKYDDVVTNYNKMIFERSFENRELASLRDWLLPMLMNGQVTVR